jgi:hypothetical protein
MVSTSLGKKTSKRSRRDAVAAAGTNGATHAGGPAVPAEASSAEPAVRRRLPRPGRHDAGGHVAVLADLADDVEVRAGLRRLARDVRRGRGGVKQAEAILAAGSAADRWLRAEAATWAFVTALPGRRPGKRGAGSRRGRKTAPLVDRLVAEAHAALPRLVAGHSEAARFVLVLSRLCGDVDACRRLEPAAVTALVDDIIRTVSDAGTVLATGETAVSAAAMVDRVVHWTTCRNAGLTLGGLPWDKATDRRWRAAAGSAIRLLGSEGRVPSGAGLLPACRTTPLRDACLARDGGGAGRPARRTMKRLLERRSVARRHRGRRDRMLPLSVHDADAAVTVLRSDWSAGGIRVLVDHRGPTPRLEIAMDDRLLVDGPWGCAISIDGRPAEPRGGWRVSCWETGRKATVLELSTDLSDGATLERQVVLLPRDRVVLLADGIRAAGATVGMPDGGPAAIEYRGVVPLAAEIECEAAAETREVFCFDTTMRFLALPPALSEWRGVGRGNLEATPAGLVLSQSGHHRLYAPLWLDCEAARLGGPLTWRQLTVADTRIILPPHQAAGFRIQAGDEQWLLYQSLDVPRNRTLLGCNVACDLLVGRLKRSGEVARMLEIQ